MKKVLLSLAICLLAVNVSFAQEDGILAQPTHFVAKRINVDGEITLALDADFSYDEEGKVVAFACPQYGLTASYLYAGNYLRQEGVTHRTPPEWGGNDSYMEFLKYTYYEDGQIKHFTHESEENIYDCEYSYDEHGRLKQKEYKNGYGVTEYHQHCIYDYGNEDRTQTESYWTSWPSEGLKLRKKTVFQYDDDFKLNTVFTQYYDIEGDTTSTTLLTYIYTPSGKEESQIKQTLTDGIWGNTSIQRYIYDEYDRVIEQQNGSWSAENNEWNINKKTTFTYEPQGENAIYTVSFYKKSGEDWVWDVFDSKNTILFGSELKTQQNTLRHFYFDEVHGGGDINQFEFTFINTQRPVYLDLEENENLVCTAHPNPTTGQVTISGTNLKQAKVINTLGQCVATVKGEGEQFTLDISNLPAGVYFVNITDGEGRKCVRKVVKE